MKYIIEYVAVKSKAIKKGKELGVMIRKGEDIKDMRQYCADAMREMVMEVREKSIGQNALGVGLSLITTTICAVVNSFASGMFTGLGFLPEHSAAMGAVFSAPLIEEATKHINIKVKNGLINGIVFNLMEFTGYVSMMVSQGVPLPVAAFVRSFGVMFHFGTTILQKAHIIKAREEGKDEMDRKKIENVGLANSMLLHGVVNGLASLTQVSSDERIRKIGQVGSMSVMAGLGSYTMTGKKKRFEGKVRNALRYA